MAEQLITSGTVFRKKKGVTEWLLIKNKEGKWEFLKILVKRGESSVGAILRVLREGMGFVVEVLEESGRHSQISSKNGTKIQERTIYYLIEEKGDRIKIEENTREEKWFQHPQATKALGAEREKKILKKAREVLKEYLKKKK